jgi:hypothetical protein
MNIEQAKNQVKKACIAYLTKDEFGKFVVQPKDQRPLFLLGAPGVGKTAIVSQVACELNLGLVDYSMTHHTRQSAIGLPVLKERIVDGKPMTVSEYSLSEIIASIYDQIERGHKTGILFLDEINCISESLTPMMLRFLQEKKFGNHQVPAGWVIVCAGNPPEFNKSAKMFDIATLDRVKRINIEPDLDAWRTWAYGAGAHRAVLSFLSMRPDAFYQVQTHGHDQLFVTARAWFDLSTMMHLYEKNGLEIDEALIGQYVQMPQVAADFYNWIENFAQLEQTYDTEGVLAGQMQAIDNARARLDCADFDEHATLCGLLVDACATKCKNILTQMDALQLVFDTLSSAKKSKITEGQLLISHIAQGCEQLENTLSTRDLHFKQHPEQSVAYNRAISCLRTYAAKAKTQVTLSEISEDFNSQLSAMNTEAARTAAAINNLITFVFDTFGAGNQAIICMRELTANPLTSKFIANFEVAEYARHAGILATSNRESNLQARLQEITQGAL